MSTLHRVHLPWGLAGALAVLLAFPAGNIAAAPLKPAAPAASATADPPADRRQQHRRRRQRRRDQSG